MSRGFESHQPAPIAIGSTDRATFLMKTYGHLLGAVLAFVGVEAFLFSSGIAREIAVAMSRLPWIAILGVFMIVGWMARSVAHRSSSVGLQYLALAGYVVAQAVIFIPLLYVAQFRAGGGVIESAAAVTMLGFGTLTFVVFVTRKDFSFLRPLLMWGGILAIGAIVLGAIFGFNLGMLFSVLMVALAGGAILYDTSNVLHHYPNDRYVAASLELFASVALLFWYILRIFLSARN